MTEYQVAALCLNVIGAMLASYSVFLSIVHCYTQNIRANLIKEFKISLAPQMLVFVFGVGMVVAGLSLPG